MSRKILNYCITKSGVLLSMCFVTTSLLGASSVRASNESPPSQIEPTTLGEPETLDDRVAVSNLSRSARFTTLDTQINLIKHRIEQIEWQEGGYSDRLSQEVETLADLYLQKNDLEPAIKEYKRASHIVRINEGLKSLNQVPLLQKLIDAHKRNFQWKEVNNRYFQMYQLHLDNLEAEDPKLLDFQIQLAEWHLQAFFLKDINKRERHLFNANSFYRQVLNTNIEVYGELHPKLIEPINGLITTQYLLATKKVKKSAVNRPDFFDTSSSVSMLNNAYQAYGSFNTITELIAYEQKIYLAQDVQDHPKIFQNKLKMADWCLLNKKMDCADELYKEAYAYADMHADNKELTTIAFAKPVPLYDIGNFGLKLRTLIFENTQEDLLVKKSLPKINQPEAKAALLVSVQQGEVINPPEIGEEVVIAGDNISARKVSYDPENPPELVQSIPYEFSDKLQALPTAKELRIAQQNSLKESLPADGETQSIIEVKASSGKRSTQEDKLTQDSVKPVQLSVDIESSLLVSLDISKRGIAKNITILSDNTNGDIKARRTILQFLKTTRFRPKIESGVPVNVRDLELDVSLPTI